MELLNRELEDALRTIRRLEQIERNRYQVEDAVKYDCLLSLAQSGHIELCDYVFDPELKLENHYQRLNKGRTYFQEKWRDRWMRWAPITFASLLGIAGTLGGVLLGWWIGSTPYAF